MSRWLIGSVMLGSAFVAVPSTGGAQQLRSLVPPRREQPTDIPREHRPPKGMCRIWIDGVPPDKQPAPTDCSTALKNKPRNGRVVFGDETKDEAEPDKKNKPKKP